METETEGRPSLRSERRGALRVPVQRRVRVAIGLRAIDAELRDLSVTGCRIRCSEPVTAYGNVWLLLPAGLGGRVPMPLRAEIARADSVRGERTGVCDVALRFRRLPPWAHERVGSAVRELLAEAEAAGERPSGPRRWTRRPQPPARSTARRFPRAT